MRLARTEFVAELNRLKNDVLMDIILKTCVPNGVRSELRKEIEGDDQDDFFETSGKMRDAYLEINTRVIELESGKKVLQTELKCSQYVISKLEKTIDEQDDIIDLLKKQCCNNLQIRGKGNVARSRQSSETKKRPLLKAEHSREKPVNRVKLT